MSGINVKRKKYSWLPESNPAAVSGESSSGVFANAKQEPKDKRVRQPRTQTRGEAKQKAREKVVAARAALDGLGISPVAVEDAAADTASNSGAGDTSANKPDGEDIAVGQSPGLAVTPQPAPPKARRRHRKDSVDELVRSRLVNTLNSQQDGQNTDAPPSKSATVTKPRRRSDNPSSSAVMSSITANVRDALVSEHAHSSHRQSPSQAQFGSSSAINASGTRYQRTSQHTSRSSHLFGGNDDMHGGSAFGNSGGYQNGARLDRIDSSYSFPSYAPLNVRNVGSNLRRGDRGVGRAVDYINRGPNVTTGENVVVLHAGSRWMRVGRASDAVPKELPHAIARRLKPRQSMTTQSGSGLATTPPPDANDVSEPGIGDYEQPTTGSQPPAEADGASTAPPVSSPNNMDFDDDSDRPNDAESFRKSQDEPKPEGTTENHESDSDAESESDLIEPKLTDSVDKTLAMLREALKQHQRQSKRKVPPNVYSQVLTYNKQSKPEIIKDHNDPFKIDWIVPSLISDEYLVGEKVLRVAETEDFVVRYPLRNGCFNVEDYDSIEEVLGDIETIWANAITNELGIPRRDLGTYGVVLVIPDLFSRVEVTLLADLLLRQLGFQYLLIQQSSVLVTYGAGFSSACVVDVGAQKTSIACVEFGYCYQESRVSVMYGGDDITRFLHNLFMRSNFPYHEASLSRKYDWSMLNELREKYCTMNLSDVNIRLHNFFVRQPQETNTQKHSFKAYDEVYHAPFCLFYPSIVDAYYSPPDYANTFVNAVVADTFAGSQSHVPSSLPTPTQFGFLPSKAVEIGSATGADGATLTEDESDEPLLQLTAAPATAPATVPVTAPGTPDARASLMSSADGTARAKEALLTAEATGLSRTLPSTPSVLPSISYVPDTHAQYSRMPLDQAITHSITHAGSVDSVKKLYSSIVVVGGGVSFIPGFGELLASRLMYTRPSYLKGVVERADIVSAPRDLDPRVLAWKGGAVLSRLECAKEMWITSQEWADFGPRLLRDRVFFQW
ncbi:actin-like protein arp8 [Coemansia sp. BCRC 34301]|nr:actin-like protein arp8 [Coemansia sp. BCRC 34301]